MTRSSGGRRRIVMGPKRPPTRAGKTVTDGRTNRPADRWSEPLLAQGFIPVSRVFLRNYSRLNPPLTAGEAAFVVHLMDFKRDVEPPYPSYRRLAGYMGLSDKMVRVYAQRLERKGYLIRKEMLGKTNRFDLRPLFDAVERLLSRLRVTAVGQKEVS